MAGWFNIHQLDPSLLRYAGVGAGAGWSAVGNAVSKFGDIMKNAEKEKYDKEQDAISNAREDAKAKAQALKDAAQMTRWHNQSRTEAQNADTNKIKADNMQAFNNARLEQEERHHKDNMGYKDKYMNFALNGYGSGGGDASLPPMKKVLPYGAANDMLEAGINPWQYQKGGKTNSKKPLQQDINAKFKQPKKEQTNIFDKDL